MIWGNAFKNERLLQKLVKKEGNSRIYILYICVCQIELKLGKRINRFHFVQPPTTNQHFPTHKPDHFRKFRYFNLNVYHSWLCQIIFCIVVCVISKTCRKFCIISKLCDFFYKLQQQFAYQISLNSTGKFICKKCSCETWKYLWRTVVHPSTSLSFLMGTQACVTYPRMSFKTGPERH